MYVGKECVAKNLRKLYKLVLYEKILNVLESKKERDREINITTTILLPMLQLYLTGIFIDIGTNYSFSHKSLFLQY